MVTVCESGSQRARLTDDPRALGDTRPAFSYRVNGPELFHGLTHEFAPGKVTALTGASGRGKSTLLYIMGLLLRPTEGELSATARM